MLIIVLWTTILILCFFVAIFYSDVEHFKKKYTEECKSSQLYYSLCVESNKTVREKTPGYPIDFSVWEDDREGDLEELGERKCLYGDVSDIQYYEVMDRAHGVDMQLTNLLLDHEAVIRDERLYFYCHVANQCLNEVYQIAGQKYVGDKP